jgi:hypothetical protein
MAVPVFHSVMLPLLYHLSDRRRSYTAASYEVKRLDSDYLEES